MKAVMQAKSYLAFLCCIMLMFCKANVKSKYQPSYYVCYLWLLNSLQDHTFSNCCNTDEGQARNVWKGICDFNTALLFIITFYWTFSCQPNNLMFFSQIVVGHRFWFWRLTVISNNGKIDSIDQERPSQSYALFISLLFVCFLCCMVHY